MRGRYMAWRPSQALWSAMDNRLREKLFSRPDVAAAEQRLRRLIADAAGTTSIGACYVLRDHYREQTEPRHPVTRWA